MKYIKAILLFVIFIFFLPFVSALNEEIIVTDAETVWSPDLIVSPPEMIDSLDASFPNLSEAFVTHAETVWSFNLIVVTSDVIDSIDAPSPNLSEVYVSHAQTVWAFELKKIDFEIPPFFLQKWSFAIITDLHIGRGYDDYQGEDYYLTERLKNVVLWINKNRYQIKCGEEICPIKFLAILGDITENTGLAGFCKVKEILDELKIPYIPIFGNHDVGPDEEYETHKRWKGQDYFDQVFWNQNPPCKNAPSSKNLELIKNLFSFKRDELHPDYKNFAFTYRGIGFIGLDFNSRSPFPGPPKGVGADAVLGWENEGWLEFRLKEFKGKPVIIFSHHPFVESLIYGFSEGEIKRLKEIIKNNQALANFGGHVHGFYDWWREEWRNANEDYYPPVETAQIITTEALKVGSNDIDEYLKKHDKGIIKIVKILGENEIDYKTNEGKYKPETGEGKKFIALNPYVSFTFTQPTEILPCVFFKAHAFTKREVSYHWDLGDGTTGDGKWETRCYSSPGIYNVTLTATDTKTGKKEFITQKVEVREGIIPKFLKISKEMKEKIELISTRLGEDLTKIGQVFKDNVLIKVKHSLSKPVGIITVHFEKATKDIDLTNMAADINIETKKSILYLPSWPEEVGISKVLFLPK